MSSYGVGRNELTLGAEAYVGQNKIPDDSSIDLKFILGSITEIAEALITGHWEFSTLIMVQPRSTHIPLHVFLKELIKIPIFKAQVACHGSHLLSCVYVVSI